MKTYVLDVLYIGSIVKVDIYIGYKAVLKGFMIISDFLRVGLNRGGLGLPVGGAHLAVLLNELERFD